MFPFGFTNRDRLLTRADDSSFVVFTSATGFPFLTNKEYQLSVSI